MAFSFALNDKLSVEKRDYWRRNLLRLAPLLVIWFLGSYGLGILWVDELDRFQFFGFPLGFFFAQQGSIYLFLLIIIAYIVTMNRLDAEYEQKNESNAKEPDE